VDLIDRRQLKPVEHHGLVRLGLPSDGGYVVPDAQVKDAAVLLSLGMKDNWSFDRDFVRANPRALVICVDPGVGPRFFARRIVTSVAAIVSGSLTGKRKQVRRHTAWLRNGIDYFVFFTRSRRHRQKHRHVRKLVSSHDTSTDITLASLLDIAGVDRDQSVFLKMDIEGAEYGLIPSIADHASRFSCIVAEFHGLSRKAGIFNRSIALLRRHLHIVHVHGNNYSRYDPASHFPDAVEITFVHHALMSGEPAPSQRDYPRADLDRPNHPGRPDHPLRFE
jgi:hypothetical protein